ncbi:MAG: hypothetical protein AAGG07_10265 [Planctomycetota bacterium]
MSGSDADGYFATVGFNQEANTALDDIIRNPAGPKFFDYPAYVNPNIPGNIWIMYVEPYRFGLEYPDPLHPTGPGSFASVGELRPADEAGLPGVTFIEGVTEDADFAEFDVGLIRFEAALVSGVGIEIVPTSEIDLVFDGTEFNSINRQLISPEGDVGPFGPEGRSNRNEAANTVTIEAIEIRTNPDTVLDGLVFEDGRLVSADFIADVRVESVGAAFVGFPFSADGLFTVSDGRVAFDVDDQSSLPFARDVRLLLTREGTADAVGSYFIPGMCAADFDLNGFVEAADVILVVEGVESGAVDYNGDGVSDFFDVVDFLRDFEERCGAP